MMAMAPFFQMLEIINNQEKLQDSSILKFASTHLILGQKKLFATYLNKDKPQTHRYQLT
jgi:hypothetical protein